MIFKSKVSKGFAYKKHIFGLKKPSQRICMENLSTFSDIGNVLGYPAMLLIFWLYNKVKELSKRLDEGNNRFDNLEKEMKEINKSLYIIIGKVDSMLRRSGHTPED